jgi:opacity protein-like surface antigen
MTIRPVTFAALIAVLAPLAAAAQSTDKPAADAKDQAAPPAPAKPPPVTFEVGGWLAVNAWSDYGAVNASDLPRYALPDQKEEAMGISVRQSRLRAGIGLPNDGGLLGGAVLKGLVEVDFAGGYVSGDESMPLLRLRHAYVTSTWKDLGNLTLLVGQTWDIWHGPPLSISLNHLATPRFAGAGNLYRRAPQVRLQGEVGKDLAVSWQVGALSPADKATQTASATGVGYRSGRPDLEARLAFLLRGASKVKVELGVGGRYAEEKWLLSGAAGAPNETVKSQGVAADLKVEVGPVLVVGGAFAGENLDVVNSFAPAVLTTGTSPNFTSVKSIPTKGGWGQVQVTPVKGLVLLAGAGVETPNRELLPATITVSTGFTIPSIDRNQQVSAGAILNLTSRWRVGLEYTQYRSHGIDGVTSTSNQLELGSLLTM